MFERFRRKSEDATADIQLVIVPNGITHQYHARTDLPPLTGTPHTELLGHNIGRATGERVMDDETQVLYDAVKALDRRIESVSIHPHSMSVEGPMRVNRNHLIRGDWPSSLDKEVIDVLAGHLGLSDVRVSTRHQTEQELWDHMDGIIAKAVAEGISPPEGWPYKRYR